MNYYSNLRQFVIIGDWVNYLFIVLVNIKLTVCQCYLIQFLSKYDKGFRSIGSCGVRIELVH